MLWWTSRSWKSIFGTPFLAFLGLSELKPARAPMSCVLRGGRGWWWGGEVMRQSLNWNIFSFGLKLCQWVPRPWREWYWNSNESPTGGLFTWSYTFGPLNRVFFFFNHYLFLFFSYNCICSVQINPHRWHPMTRRKPVLKYSWFWWSMAPVCFVEAALLRLYFSAQTL